MKLSKELKEFLKDEEKVKQVRDDIEFGVNFLINDLGMHESKACRFLERKLKEKYGVPFEIEWYFKNANYLIIDYLDELEKEGLEFSAFRVHIHVEDGEEAEIETL